MYLVKIMDIQYYETPPQQIWSKFFRKSFSRNRQSLPQYLQ